MLKSPRQTYQAANNRLTNSMSETMAACAGGYTWYRESPCQDRGLTAAFAKLWPTTLALKAAAKKSTAL